MVTICTIYINIQQLFMLPAECVHESRMILRVNSDYYLKQA
jgi:hypothetical protein